LHTSYGIVMWELLTREIPYDALSPAAVAVAVVSEMRRPKMPEQHDLLDTYIEYCLSHPLLFSILNLFNTKLE